MATSFDRDSAPLLSSGLIAVGIHGVLVLALGGVWYFLGLASSTPRGGAPDTIVLLGEGGMAGSEDNVIAKGRETGTLSPGEAPNVNANSTQPPETPRANSEPEPSPQPPAEPSPPEALPEGANVMDVPTAPPVEPSPLTKTEVLKTETPPLTRPLEKTTHEPTVKVKPAERTPKTPSKAVSKPVLKKVPDRVTQSPVKTPTQRVDSPVTSQALRQGASATPDRASPAAPSSASSASGEVLGTAQGTASAPSQLRGSGDGLKALAQGDGDAALIDNGDGTYRPSGKGTLQYRIIEDAQAQYPRRARAIGFTKTVRVRVAFVVNESGRIERTRVLTQGIPPLDFEEEALGAIRRMRFEPIRFMGMPVKVTFVKTIVFKP